MALTLHDFTIERIPGVAKAATVFGHTTDPGRLYCSYPVGITGPAYVDVAGTREYRLDGRGGDYLAYPGIGQDREDVTWLFEVDFSRTSNAKTSLGSSFPHYPIASCVRQDTDRRTNWAIYFRRYLSGSNDTIGIVVYDSIDSLTADAFYISYNYVYALAPSRVKFALTKASGGAYALHWGVRGPIASGTRNSTGTMGGDEVLILNQAIQMSKISRICDNAELDAWFGAGSVVPTTNREFAYLGSHEIDQSAPVVYDSADPPHDLYAYTVSRWQAPGMTLRNVDTGFTSPAFSIPLTIAADCAAGDHTITLRRNRVGVPTDRIPPLSDAELYDDGSVVVTVSDIALAGAVGPVINARVKIL